MKFPSPWGLVLLVWLGLSSAAPAQLKLGQPTFDDLVNWSDPMAMSMQKAVSFLDANTKDRSRPVYAVDSRDPVENCIHYMGGDAKTSKLENTLFGGLFEVQSMEAHYKKPGGELSYIQMSLGAQNLTKKKRGALETLLSQKTGDPSPKQTVHSMRVGGRGSRQGSVEITTLQWTNPKYQVRLSGVSTSLSLSVGTWATPGQPPPPPVVAEPAPPPQQEALAANLDVLLNFSALWQWSAADLEKSYVQKIEGQEKQPAAPQFEWVNASKDRARFSRHMFSNAETNLTMFGGSIKVEEAILEFVNGKAARATISFYNRGDSGDIEVKEFDRIFKVIGQNLSQVMKVAPKRQMMSSNAALPVTGWNWTAPGGIALLEYNEYNTPGKVTKPEFLRLKLASPTQADWSMGKMATGVQRMELLQRIKKTSEGDVYISGVPMVDQGQKGYCVAASCQRLFEYMRIPCDQHEMAKLVSIDAEGGADISTMQKSLAKIDGAFKVTFKALVNPELYYDRNNRRRVSEKEFISIIKEYADKGVPLLWGLSLGQKPEDPPLPGGGQVSGGHMRMIIGYNLAKNQVLFTDSWGAGHELKRMTMLDAYDVTMGLYSMAPRGL
jgi:hypothetical protein